MKWLVFWSIVGLLAARPAPTVIMSSAALKYVSRWADFQRTEAAALSYLKHKAAINR
jgi:hypothetical protein